MNLSLGNLYVRLWYLKGFLGEKEKTETHNTTTEKISGRHLFTNYLMFRQRLREGLRRRLRILLSRTVMAKESRVTLTGRG